MVPKHFVLMAVVALVIVFLMGFRICDGCGISAKKTFTFADTFATCYECIQKREREAREREWRERERERQARERERRAREKERLAREKERLEREILEREKKIREAKEREAPQETRQRINNILDSVRLYYSNNRNWPDTLDQLRDPINKKDAWGNSIQYKKTDDGSFEIRSAGPDGKFGTQDDIIY